MGGDEVITDHKFTGQKLDGSGLMYYNARYYDPAIGQFVSPDTLVPDPEQILAYNRYMYALGNPLKFVDPSGNCNVLGDGSHDWQGDGECWQTAFAIYGYGHGERGFADDWNITQIDGYRRSPVSRMPHQITSRHSTTNMSERSEIEQDCTPPTGCMSRLHIPWNGYATT